MAEFRDNQKVTGGALKRARRRAKNLGQQGVLRGGVTGAEARQLRGAAGKRRSQRVANKALYDPSAVLGGQNLKRSVASLVRGEIRPQVSELDRQIGANRLQGQALQGRASDYYRMLAEQEAKAQAVQGAISTNLQGRLSGIAGDTQKAIGQVGDQASAAVTADAAQRGAGLDGGAREKLAAELAAQQGRAAQTGQAFQSASALSRGAAETQSAQMAQANQMRGADVQSALAGQQAGREVELMGQRADVRAKAGPLRTKLLTELRQAGFDQLATMGGLDLKQAELQANIADDKRDARTTRRGQNVTMRGQNLANRIAQINTQLRSGELDETTRHHLKQELADLKKDQGLTPTQVRARRGKIEQAVGALKSGSTKVNGKVVSYEDLLRSHPEYASKIHDRLQAKYGKRVADEAMRRFNKTRKRGGGLLGDLQDFAGSLPG